MDQKLVVSEKILDLLRKCLARAGYPAALSRECGISQPMLHKLRCLGTPISWWTVVSLVDYARAQGIVGRYFDPITLEDPPSQDISAASHEAAWMLDHLPADERQRLMDQIAAAYGRSVARAGDEGEGRAGGVA